MRYTEKLVNLVAQVDMQSFSFAKIRRTAVIAVLCAGYIAGMFFGYFLSY